QGLLAQILERTTSPEVHDRAWLQLAKTRYLRGQPDAALDAMGRIGQALKEDHAGEQRVLQGLIEIKQEQLPQALNVLSGFPDNNPWSPYGRYNRAIALLRMERRMEGLLLLEEITAAEVENEEEKSLQDRANLVRGLILLQTGEPALAKQVLEQIRISSLTANQALLGVGWAALQLDDPQAALPPWQELANREEQDTAVLDAVLAIPYALSLLEDDEQSLQHYQLGIARFDQELQRLDQAIAAIRSGALLPVLDNQQPLDQQAARPLLGLLPLLMTGNEFQEHLHDYRDLRFLLANLQQWQEKIDDYQTMLSVREAAYNERLPRVEEKLSGEQLQQLEAEREILQQRFERARSPEEPLFILATGREKHLLKRFKVVEGMLDEYAARLDLHDQREQAKLLKGVLIWDSIVEHPVRIWESGKRLRELDQAIETTRSEQAALQMAHQQTQGQFEGFEEQIHALEAQIPSLLSEVDRARFRQGELLQRMAIRVLEARKILLNDYLIQARMGVASLLDRNQQSPGGVE
ncbi:MAG: hypothetical protein QNJ78_15160, partial [Gammaproteobacteria bacterium]|nr:hypothetical protein [Gammaproteobacteria bacterium]